MLGAKDDIGDGFDAGDGLIPRDEVNDVVEGGRVARLWGCRVGWEWWWW